MAKVNRQLLNKCECCGALFQGDYCEYCHAKYNFYEDEEKEEKHKEISVISGDLESHKITLRFGDKIGDFYITEWGYEPLDYGSVPQMEIRLMSYGNWRDVEDGSVREDKSSSKSSKRVGGLRKRSTK